MTGLTTAGLVTTLHAKPVLPCLGLRACAVTRPCMQRNQYSLQVMLPVCMYSSGTVSH